MGWWLNDNLTPWCLHFPAFQSRGENLGVKKIRMICGRMVQIWAVYSLSRNMPMLKGLHLFKVCLVSISYSRNIESNDGPSTLSKVIHVLFSLLPFSLIFTQIGVPIIRSCNFLPTNYAPMFFPSEIFFRAIYIVRTIPPGSCGSEGEARTV